MEKFLKIQFNASLKNVPMARALVSSFFLNEEYTLNIINEVKTIISEGVTNAIVHGYKVDSNSDSPEIVTLNLFLVDNTLTIEIIDEGIGIENIAQAKEPLYSSKVTEERAGLGFTIMEIFSDELKVVSSLNNGTKLYITKNL